MSKALLQHLIPTIFPVHIFTVLHVKIPYMHTYGTTNKNENALLFIGQSTERLRYKRSL